MEREPAVPLTRTALRGFLRWRSSRGGITKREAVEIAYDVLTKALDPVILTTATYTEWLSQGYIAEGWGASPGEFHERKWLEFVRPPADGVELERETAREAEAENGSG
jgi:hypothetical protein